MRTGAADRTAFREMYALTSAKLFGICLRICGDAQAAEDVLHEVYLTVWRRAGAYEPGRASPITWLGTIARNRALDWRRANPARRALSLDEAPEQAAPGAQDLAMIADEGAMRLRACLDTLEPRTRDAIRTAFFDGASYPELAALADVPLGTMKSWIRRGLARLKECLGDER